MRVACLREKREKTLKWLRFRTEKYGIGYIFKEEKKGILDRLG
jgi:hypothetical protein